ncbi:hypothetical protein ACFLTE_08395 [Bacteroidota bacterium]
MEFKEFKIAGILINHEVPDINSIQDILTSYGNVIRSRLGISDPVDNINIKGLIILELAGDPQEIKNLLSEISEINGVQVKDMEFEDFI